MKMNDCKYAKIPAVPRDDSESKGAPRCAQAESRWIEARLPPDQLINPHKSEAAFYGASWLIARSLGLPAAPRTIASWTHGWQQPDVRLALIQYFLERLGIQHTDCPHLAATEDEADHLRRAGLRDVAAVGMPFVYAADVSVERVPGSLLVMPPHSHPYTSHEWHAEDYASLIANLRPRFSRVVACISRSCITKGYWTGAFEQAGIPWVVGAWPGDANALTRMATIFRSFEYVTTNFVSSHVPYAAYCGCKVSVYGPYAEYKPGDFKEEQFYVRFPQLLPIILERCSEAAMRSLHPELFVHPRDAVPCDPWARGVLGAASRKEPEQIARLLRWPGFTCTDTRVLQLEVCRRQVLQEAHEATLASREQQLEALRNELSALKSKRNPVAKRLLLRLLSRAKAAMSRMSSRHGATISGGTTNRTSSIQQCRGAK